MVFDCRTDWQTHRRETCKPPEDNQSPLVMVPLGNRNINLKSSFYTRNKRRILCCSCDNNLNINYNWKLTITHILLDCAFINQQMRCLRLSASYIVLYLKVMLTHILAHKQIHYNSVHYVIKEFQRKNILRPVHSEQCPSRSYSSFHHRTSGHWQHFHICFYLLYCIIFRASIIVLKFYFQMFYFSKCWLTPWLLNWAN